MHPWITEHGRAALFTAVVMMMSLTWCAYLRAEVRLVELLPDPASDWNGDGQVDTRADEWIEVLNTGPDTVDLSEYTLLDALGDDPQLRLSGLLAPGAVAVFYGSDAEAWQQAEGLSVTGLSLNNAGDELDLWLGDPREPGAVRVDACIYPSHVGEDDRSAARYFPQDEWVLCDGLNPYGGSLEPAGTGCEPTPGEPNACEGLVPAERASWGGMKSVYRP